MRQLFFWRHRQRCVLKQTAAMLNHDASSRQVEILVDDGSGSDDDGTNNAVPASSLTPVTTSSLLFDTNLAVDGGCDPNGCTASNTQVG